MRQKYKGAYNMRKSAPQRWTPRLFGFNVWWVGDCIIISDTSEFYVPPPEYTREI